MSGQSVKNFNGHNSATRHPIPFKGGVFCDGGSNGGISVWIISQMAAGSHLKKTTSNGHISATRHPIDFVFGSMLGFLARTD